MVRGRFRLVTAAPRPDTFPGVGPLCLTPVLHFAALVSMKKERITVNASDQAYKRLAAHAERLDASLASTVLALALAQLDQLEMQRAGALIGGGRNERQRR